MSFCRRQICSELMHMIKVRRRKLNLQDETVVELTCDWKFSQPDLIEVCESCETMLCVREKAATRMVKS